MPERGRLSRAELDRRWSLLLPYRERALRVARGRVPAADVEDLANEALLRAVTMPRLDESTLGGLISTITMRLAVDHHRREQATRILEERRMVASNDESAAEEVCDRAEAAWLAQETDRLNVQDREVLLHRAAGHSAASAASQLGITYKSAGSALTRARGEMKALWRSTLGILAGFGAYIRRGSARGVTAAPLVAAASICLLLAPVWKSPAADKDTPQLRPARPAADPTPGAPTSPPTRPPSPAAMLSTKPPTSTVISTGTIGDRRLVQTGARVENRDEDQSLTQTLGECLTYGLIVELDQVDCRSPDGP